MKKRTYIVLSFIFILTISILTDVFINYKTQLIVCMLLCTVFGIVGYIINDKNKFKVDALKTEVAK